MEKTKRSVEGTTMLNKTNDFLKRLYDYGVGKIKTENANFYETAISPKFRELANDGTFHSRGEAQVIIKSCRQYDNTRRLDSELGNRPLAPQTIISMDQRATTH